MLKLVANISPEDAIGMESYNSYIPGGNIWKRDKLEYTMVYHGVKPFEYTKGGR